MRYQLRNYLFKNLNILFLTCALAFISIANAQEFVHTVSNKGTKGKVFIPTTAEIYDNGLPFSISTTPWYVVFFQINDDATDINNPEHYESGPNYIKVKKAGTYKVSYRVTAKKSSGVTASRTEYNLHLNNSVVGGTFSAAYHKGDTSRDTASASQILVLGIDDELKVEAKRYGTSPVSTVPFASSLLVECIKLTPP